MINGESSSNAFAKIYPADARTTVVAVSVTIIVVAAVVIATITGLWWWRRKRRQREEAADEGRGERGPADTDMTNEQTIYLRRLRGDETSERLELVIQAGCGSYACCALPT